MRQLDLDIVPHLFWLQSVMPQVLVPVWLLWQLIR